MCMQAMFSDLLILFRILEKSMKDVDEVLSKDNNN